MAKETAWDPFDRSFENRQPDRRWRYLSDLTRNRDHDRSLLRDPRVAVAVWFCRGLIEPLNCKQIPQSVNPTELADISEARRVFTRLDYRRTKDLLEACTYARLTAAEIANRLHLQPAVVDWYIFLFHDIRRFLDYPLMVWASDHLLGKLQTIKGNADESLLLKAVAYSRGADALFRFADGPQSFVAEDWEWVLGAIRQRFGIAAWNAAMGVRPTTENAVHLADLGLDYQMQPSAPECLDTDAVRQALNDLLAPITTGDCQ
mgnify:CR=1 FL=1